MSKAPVRLYNMTTGESKVLLKGAESTIEYVTPTPDGKIISFTYGEENKSLGASLKLALMKSLTVTDFATKNPTTTQYTLSPEVQKYLSQYEDMNMKNNLALDFEYGFTSGSINPDTISLHGLSHDLLLSLKGKTVIKAEIKAAQN